MNNIRPTNLISPDIIRRGECPQGDCPRVNIVALFIHTEVDVGVELVSVVRGRDCLERGYACHGLH